MKTRHARAIRAGIETARWMEGRDGTITYRHPNSLEARGFNHTRGRRILRDLHIPPAPKSPSQTQMDENDKGARCIARHAE